MSDANKNNSSVDEILKELSAHRTGKTPHKDDVTSILAGLGLSSDPVAAALKAQPAVRSAGVQPAAPAQPATEKQPKQREKARPAPKESAAVLRPDDEVEFEKAFDNIKARQSAQREAAVDKAVESVRQDNRAPVASMDQPAVTAFAPAAAAMQQSHSGVAARAPKEPRTVEMPHIKAYSALQEQQKKELEQLRAEVQSTSVRPSGKYDIPGHTTQPSNVFSNVDVDKNFIEFFSNTIAVDRADIESARAAQEEKKVGFWKRLFARKNRADEDEDYIEKQGEESEPDAAQQFAQPYRTGTVSGFAINTFDSTPLPLQQENSAQRDLTIQAPLASARRSIADFDIALGDTAEHAAPLSDTPQEEEEELAEYNNLSDAPAIAKTLKNQRNVRCLRMVVTGLLALVLLYVGLSARESVLPIVGALDPQEDAFAFLIFNFSLLAAGALVSVTTLGSGLAGLVSTATPDTLPAVAAVAALVQNIAYLFRPGYFDVYHSTLFAPLALVLLCANAVGKYLHNRTVCINFEMASAGYEHAAACIVPDEKLTRKLCGGMGEPEPVLLVSRPTALVKGFLQQSFSARSGDEGAKKLAYVLLGVSAACGLLCGWLGEGLFAGLSGFAGAACLGAPLASTLLYAVPGMMLQHAAAKVGAVVPGPSAVQALGAANTVLVNALDLFPATSVRLHGIKTFEKERIDLAILYATSILADRCETLRDTFLKIIENKTEMLYPVENAATEIGYGFTGWIAHNRVIVGNRAMMQRHDIDIPSLDYENKYTKNGTRSPIYLAVAGKLFGMFLVSYKADPTAAAALEGLERGGLGVLVESDDFNITGALIARTYGLPEDAVKVMNKAEQDAAARYTSYAPESEGAMTHVGTFASFVGGLRAASGAASAEHAAGVVQTVAVYLSALLALALSFSTGLPALALGAALLYQVVWMVITILVPLFKKY